jgi:hypothetical protein
MKKIIIVLFAILSQTICAIAQKVGDKVSFLAVNGKMYTGVVTEIKGALYNVKYDGYNFSAWLDNSQFKVVENQDPQVIIIDPNNSNTNVFDPAKNKKTPGSDLLDPSTNVNTTSMPSTWNPHIVKIKTSGPYTPQCTESPLNGVPEFSSFLVPEEKTLLDYISESCLGSAADAVNSLVDLVDEVSKISSEATAAYNNVRKQPGQVLNETQKMAKEHENLGTAAADAYKKTKTLVENMTTLAAGPELYVVSCMWDGVKEYAGATSGGKIMSDLDNIRKTTENFGKAKKSVQAKLDSFRIRMARGGALSMTDMKLFTDWEDIKKNITSTTKSLNLLVAYVSNPKKLLPYETQAELAISSAETMMRSLNGNCQIQVCDDEIKDGVLAGQQALVGARRYTAQMHKLEDKWRQKINDVVDKSYPQLKNWEYRNSDDPSLDPIQSMYDQYVPPHNERISGEQQVKKIEKTLNKLGDLCSRLGPLAAMINSRISEYQLIYYKAVDALAACNNKNAESGVAQLQHLENSDCGHFFPTLEENKYSEDLLKKIRDSKESGKCKPKQGSGDWVLVSTKVVPENPKVTWTHNEWNYSEKGTEAHYSIYNGAFKIDFKWTPPPESFSSNGFTIDVSFNATTANNQSISSVIGVSASGVSSDTPDDQDHRAAMATGNGSVSASKSVNFKPMPNATDIEVRIGMHWAVTYTYKYHRM